MDRFLLVYLYLYGPVHKFKVYQTCFSAQFQAVAKLIRGEVDFGSTNTSTSGC
jgi:hypothetical protein